MSVFSKHKVEIGEKNHVGFSGSIESQFLIWPGSKTQSVITAENDTIHDQNVRKYSNKKLKIKEWNWNKTLQVLYYTSA